MKTMKILLAVAMAGFFATAAHAADGAGSAKITKGGKPYQSARTSAPDQTQTSEPSQTANAASAEDMANMAPAAGGDEPAAEGNAPKSQKTLREEMRLPRKN